ncbi:hypothetical protein BDB01DRAFT_909875 [Pilobolus umbonatus]|nr:hypothetical protein BDB01DRAFT_909875 [Pilobolus umbonatus]
MITYYTFSRYSIPPLLTMLVNIKNFFVPTRYSSRELINPFYEGMHILKKNLNDKNDELLKEKHAANTVIYCNNHRRIVTLQMLEDLDEDWEIFLNSPNMILLEEEIADKIMDRNLLAWAVTLCQDHIKHNRGLLSSIHTKMKNISFRLEAADESKKIFTDLFVRGSRKIKKKMASFSCEQGHSCTYYE